MWGRAYFRARVCVGGKAQSSKYSFYCSSCVVRYQLTIFSFLIGEALLAAVQPTHTVASGAHPAGRTRTHAGTVALERTRVMVEVASGHSVPSVPGFICPPLLPLPRVPGSVPLLLSGTHVYAQRRCPAQLHPRHLACSLTTYRKLVWIGDCVQVTLLVSGPKDACHRHRFR